MEHRITTPLTREKVRSLHAGDQVLLSGVIYTARDAAHKRLCELVDKGEPLPIELNDAVIYYAGPTPARPGQIIGSCGPTTSGRMDAYAPTLLHMGLRGMIGKGSRSQPVCTAIQETGSVYFAAIGGAGALAAACVKQAELICYEDLGSEAIRRLVVEDMPLIVVVDSFGKDLYQDGPELYRNR
ncbi:Fe-S-containing hydro-lyase [uncultured Ruthenibacterium sp.]|uniref:Fe-S-containing hydro-lyase n=1 Tax=uncultured Ruthenibacterium sp. TaxID=1905347 RepID=UPI00349ECE82